MRRIEARWASLLLLCAIAPTALGCATTGSSRDQSHDVRKANSHLEVGGDHLANGRSALALREFLAAEKRDPKNPRVHYALGEAYLARGKQADAERHLRRALDLFDEYHDARLSLSALLLLAQRYEETIAECEILIDDPTFSSPWRALANRGWAEFQLGRVQQARETLALAREYRNDYWPAMLATAIIDAETGHRLEAIRLFQDIIAQGPGASVESEVNYRIAEVYVALGKRREAVGHLTTAVARAPQSHWAKKSQAYLETLH